MLSIPDPLETNASLSVFIYRQRGHMSRLSSTLSYEMNVVCGAENRHQHIDARHWLQVRPTFPDRVRGGPTRLVVVSMLLLRSLPSQSTADMILAGILTRWTCKDWFWTATSRIAGKLMTNLPALSEWIAAFKIRVDHRLPHDETNEMVQLLIDEICSPLLLRGALMGYLQHRHQQQMGRE